MQKNFWFERVHPDDREKVLLFHSQEKDSLSLNQSFLEYRFVTFNQKVLTLKQYITHIEKEEGKPRFLFGHIVLEKEKEKAAPPNLLKIIPAELETLETILSEIPYGAFVLDITSGEVISKNRAANKFFNSSVRPRDQTISWPQKKEFLEGKTTKNEEMEFCSQEGLSFFLVINAFPLYGPEGTLIAEFVFFHDITHSKNIERILSDTLTKYEDMIDTIDGIVWETDTNFNFTYVSRKAERLLGHPLRSWMETPNFWASHIHPLDRDESIKFCMEQTKALLPHEFEYRFIDKDGKTIWLRDIVSVVLDSQGKLAGLRGIMVDITSKKQLEFEREDLLKKESHLRNQAETALKDRDLFLAIAAHELKTPLTPVKLQIGLLKRYLLPILPQFQTAGSNLYPSLCRSLESLEHQVDSLTKLVEELLETSQISSGKMVLNLEKFDLSELAFLVLDTFKTKLADQKLPLQFTGQKGIIGRWDKMKIEQVLANILSNAIKFGRGKPIEVSVRKKGGKARLLIKDNGVGIAPENIENIFNRFEQEKNNNHFGGLGLGLYISREIVQRHQGKIWVVSKLGKGSYFGLDLPMSL